MNLINRENLRDAAIAMVVGLMLLYCLTGCTPQTAATEVPMAMGLGNSAAGQAMSMYIQEQNMKRQQAFMQQQAQLQEQRAAQQAEYQREQQQLQEQQQERQADYQRQQQEYQLELLRARQQAQQP